MNKWRSSWTNEWIYGWLHEWMIERENELMYEYMNVWMDEFMNKLMKYWKIEWINEQTYEWMNESAFTFCFALIKINLYFCLACEKLLFYTPSSFGHNVHFIPRLSVFIWSVHIVLCMWFIIIIYADKLFDTYCRGRVYFGKWNFKLFSHKGGKFFK